MKLVKIGTVDVDAGVVMIGDPCYSLPEDATHRSTAAKDWARFCEALGARPTLSPSAAVSRSSCAHFTVTASTP